MDDSASDTDTLRGYHASGTDTESVASSRVTDRNRRKKEKKKASKAAKAAASVAGGSGEGVGNGAAASSSSTPAEPGLVVEYVSQRDDLDDNPEFAELAKVFGHFTTAEELLNGKAGASGADDGEGNDDDAEGGGAAGKKAKKALAAGGADDGEDGDGEGAHLSSKAKKRAKRLSIAELKQLVQRPEVVEAWDVTSDDPRLLVHLKAYRNTIPVPKHWCQKRKFLMGKRGSEKPPFQLPEFIAATGIEKIRNAVMEKENAKRLKGKMKERMQPKMGKIDIDYQVLHDAFFKFQTKPRLSKHGDVYYEGKEHEAALREKRPGQLSAELSKALEIPAGGPPPWLVNMQRYGPPPSYMNLKIPGLNAPIPEGASYGFHAGGWGKPPVDEFGRPLYGDVFGTVESASAEKLADGLSREPWGQMEEEEDDDEDEDEDEDADGYGGEDGSALGDDELAAGISSVTSTAASGLATPDALNLRKTMADGMATPGASSSGGMATPDGPAPQLFTVLEQTSAKVGGAAFGSSHGYVVPPPPPGGIGTAGGSNRVRGGLAGSSSGVELALDPSELENLDAAALKARYDSLRKAEGEANAPEDVSDIIAEQERKRKRKLEGRERR